MTISKFPKIILVLFALTFLATNCNKISKGQQRKKFEYLYKLSTQASLLREYTHGINYFKDLGFYEGRMQMLYTEINNFETIKDWGESRTLKENFLKIIEENLKTVETLKAKDLKADENIKMEYDVIIMNERVGHFMDSLEDAISEAGRE